MAPPLGPTSSGDLLTITSGFTWLQLTGRLNFLRIPSLRAPSIRGCLATTGGIHQARRPQRSCKVAKAITSKPTNQINGGGVGFINMEVEVPYSNTQAFFRTSEVAYITTSTRSEGFFRWQEGPQALFN
jgi:hypothetical protein